MRNPPNSLIIEGHSYVTNAALTDDRFKPSLMLHD